MLFRVPSGHMFYRAIQINSKRLQGKSAVKNLSTILIASFYNYNLQSKQRNETKQKMC